MVQQPSIEQAVIFAGGSGERLRPLTNDLPKPLAPVNGVPFLDYLLEALRVIGIKRVLLLLGYKADKIMGYYDGQFIDGAINIEYSVGAVEDLTGRRLINAYPQLDEEFLLMYGDNYWPIEWQDMLSLYRSKGVLAMTTVFNNRHGTGEYGSENNIAVKSDNMVLRYDKSRQSPGLNGVDIGFFIVNRKVVPRQCTQNISFEEVVLPELVQSGQLAAHLTCRQYYYITNMSSLQQFERYVSESKIGYIGITEQDKLLRKRLRVQGLGEKGHLVIERKIFDEDISHRTQRIYRNDIDQSLGRTWA
jgi:D-glycero-D-manno-heptose 1,7-bisphosphate phosphatase